MYRLISAATLALGIDPVQFGLVFVLNWMIGTVTLPRSASSST